MHKNLGGGNVNPTLKVHAAVATSVHSAASDAALAARKAVGTLQSMKASADAMAATAPPPAPSKAAVKAKIMEEARKSAAKTVARLEKKEAQAQKQKAAKKELMQLQQITHMALNSPPVHKVAGVISESRSAEMKREIQQAAVVEEKKAVAVQKMLKKAQSKHTTK